MAVVPQDNIIQVYHVWIVCRTVNHAIQQTIVINAPPHFISIPAQQRAQVDIQLAKLVTTPHNMLAPHVQMVTQKLPAHQKANVRARRDGMIATLIQR